MYWKIYFNNIAISTFENNTDYGKVIAAQAADELLNIEAGNIYAFFRDEPRAERIVAEYEQLLTTVLSCVRPATPHHAESFIPVATSTPTPDVPRYLKTAGWTLSKQERPSIGAAQPQ